MKCHNDMCRCACHISTETHVPVCPQHCTPLEPSWREPGHGYCGDCRRAGVHAHHAPRWWGWLHRDVFNESDLPPHNGMRSLPVPDNIDELAV